MKKYKMLLMFFIFLPAVAWAKNIINLDRYNKIDKVAAIMDNKSVISVLKKTLGKNYEEFPVDNSDWFAFAEPHKTSDGGLFVEAWLYDLYLYKAGAFVILPDGKLYAGWVIPCSEIINYATNDNSSTDIHPDIKEWAERFKYVHMSFSASKKCPSEQYLFNSNHFNIKITTGRASDGQCNKATYYGVRKKDGATMILDGRACRYSCDQHPCDVLGFEFKNGSTDYSLDMHPNTIRIHDNGKILVDEKGIWSGPYLLNDNTENKGRVSNEK